MRILRLERDNLTSLCLFWRSTTVVIRWVISSWNKKKTLCLKFLKQFMPYPWINSMITQLTQFYGNFQPKWSLVNVQWEEKGEEKKKKWDVERAKGKSQEKKLSLLHKPGILEPIISIKDKSQRSAWLVNNLLGSLFLFWPDADQEAASLSRFKQCFSEKLVVATRLVMIPKENSMFIALIGRKQDFYYTLCMIKKRKKYWAEIK